MHVAQLTADDLAQYRALMLEAYAQAPTAFTSTPEERAAEPESWWARRVANPRGLTATFGAFRDAELIGTVALELNKKPKTRHKARLIAMYVKPEARGLGAGRLLVSSLLEYAVAQSGLEVITLTVTQGNAPAESLYKSFGFEAFGVEPMAIRGPEGYLDKVHMWHRVRADDGTTVELGKTRA